MINFDLFGKPYFPEVLPLRIPYMGSKRKIARQLFEKMLEIKPKAKYFYDLFGGGGAMSFFAIQIGLTVVYNEKQKGMVDLLQFIINRAKNEKKGRFGLFPDDFYKFINREEFNVLKNEGSIKGQFARICYSFGNNQQDYLFGEIEELKHLAHNVVIFQDKEALKKLNHRINFNVTISDKNLWNDRRLDFMQQINSRRDLKELEQLQRLQQLEQLERLEQLQQLEQLPKFTITNLDFREVIVNTPIDQTIVYLDPPYRGTAKYIEDTISDEIDEYFKNSKYSCFMSEYNAPFESVLAIKKESLLNNANLVERKYVTEKLYFNNIF